ncbi:MAG: MFS transporter [Stackebrandtia sp.]
MSAGEAAPGRSLRGLAGVLSANVAAWTGTRLLWIALPWFVLSTTGSAAKTGLVVFAQMGPFVVSQVLSGPLIDRIGPRRVSIVCDLTALVAMSAAPLLYLADALSLWTLMALMAVVGAADGPSNSAKGVFVPSATRAAKVPLERGTGLVGAAERTASTVGPAIAGVVVAAFGGIYALWIAAALFGLGALVVATTLHDPKPEEHEQKVEQVDGYLAQLRQGATFLRSDGLLRSIIGMVAVTNLLDQAFMAVLLPVWAKSSGHGPEVIGLIASVFSAFSIVASLAAAAYGHRLPRRAVYLIGFVIGGVPRFAMLALGVPLWAILVVVAVGGLGSGFINPILGAVQYERIPTPLLGRVKTLSHALAWSGIPFGGLVGGALIALTSLTGALWIVGGCYLVAIVLPGMRREWSQMNRSADDAEQSAAVP